MAVTFQDCLELCNVTQHIHLPNHLHVPVLVPTELSVVLNVPIVGFISDHALLQLNFISPSAPNSNTVVFRR